MDDMPVFLGPTPQHLPPPGAEGAYVDLAGTRFFRITNVDTMAPFLMTLASDSDPGSGGGQDRAARSGPAGALVVGAVLGASPGALPGHA